jgi:hypothetical protein
MMIVLLHALHASFHFICISFVFDLYLRQKLKDVDETYDFGFAFALLYCYAAAKFGSIRMNRIDTIQE